MAGNLMLTPFNITIDEKFGMKDVEYRRSIKLVTPLYISQTHFIYAKYFEWKDICIFANNYDNL